MNSYLKQFLIFFLYIFSSHFVYSQESAFDETQTAVEKSLVESDLISDHKQEYHSCLMKRGLQIYRREGLSVAMDLAPLACRRKLLMVKKTLLNSAFRVEVIDTLIESIQEGGRIDLVNYLIDIRSEH